jgi:50S ribosomal subunit-associated GTPase HflX
MVYNKCDRIGVEELKEFKDMYPEAVFISARTSNGIEELKEKISSILF